MAINMKRLEMKARRVAANHPANKAKAERLAAEMRRLAAEHVDTGELLASIRVVEERDADGLPVWTVQMSREHLDDIENGHWAADTWVPGLKIAARALDNVRNGAA